MELTTLESIELSTQSQKLLVESLAKRVEDGEESAINVAAKIKFFTDSLKEVSERIKPMLIDEISRYDKSEKPVAYGFYQCEVKEMGVKYDYSNCNHPRLNEVVSQIEKLDKERKEIEKFLQSVKASMAIADESTEGEMITIYPPIKKSTTTPVFTYKR